MTAYSVDRVNEDMSRTPLTPMLPGDVTWSVMPNGTGISVQINTDTLVEVSAQFEKDGGTFQSDTWFLYGS